MKEQTAETIRLTPTWREVMPGLIEALRNGAPQQIQAATSELMSLAEAVDNLNGKTVFSAEELKIVDDVADALDMLLDRLDDHGSIDPVREEGPIEDAEQALAAYRVCRKPDKGGTP